MFGRPHKFHKRGNWGHAHGPATESSTAGAQGCPFSQGESSRSRPPRTAADMFDLNTLYELISSLGLQIPEDQPTCQASSSTQAAPSSAQASSSTQGAPSSAQAQASTGANSARTPGQKPVPQPTEYLSGIGQAIVAFLDPFGVDVSFDVRPKSGETPSTPSHPVSTPASASAPATPAASTPAPSPSATKPPTPGPSQINQPLVMTSTSPVRRNSDDWTLLNRESPTRNVEVMEVEETRPKTMYPELPNEKTSASTTASAPAEPTLNDKERPQIQEAIDRIRSMGFNFDDAILRELLKRENCDIASVLELILTNIGKK